jgi:hypothetical protein
VEEPLFSDPLLSRHFFIRVQSPGHTASPRHTGTEAYLDPWTGVLQLTAPPPDSPEAEFAPDEVVFG